jgi:VanZ family protein
VLHLRYPRAWLAVGWLLLFGVCVGSLLPGDSLGEVGRINDKILHAGSYFLLMIWFAGLYPRRLHGVIAIVLLILGIALEFVQDTLASRYFDPRDIAANAAGVLLGLALSVSLLEGWCQRVERRLFA